MYQRSLQQTRSPARSSPSSALDLPHSAEKSAAQPSAVGERPVAEGGFVAGRSVVELGDRERQLEDALMLGDPITELPMAMEVNYFQLNRSEYFIPVSVKVPAGHLTFERDRAAIDLIGEVKDERGVTVQNLRDKLEIPLTADLAAELATRPIQYEAGFTLLPGRYTIKLLARDATNGRIGTFQTVFVVPNLSRETATVRTSSVVLGSQRVGVTETLFAVRQKIQTDVVDPLVAGGTRLLPSVTRVFSASRDLQVLLHAYRMEGEANGPLVAFVSLYRDDVKVRDSDALRADVASALVPLRVTMSLAGVTPGRYDCQVSVLDLGLRKARFWRATITVVP